MNIKKKINFYSSSYQEGEEVLVVTTKEDLVYEYYFKKNGKLANALRNNSFVRQEIETRLRKI